MEGLADLWRNATMSIDVRVGMLGSILELTAVYGLE